MSVNHRVHKAFGLRPSGVNVRLLDGRVWLTTDLEALRDEEVKQHYFGLAGFW